MSKIAIVDYGVGNLSSIENMFKRIGIDALITSDPHQIEASEKMVLPGVGAFDSCVEKFDRSGLREVIDDLVNQKQQPILGICVGLQMMTEKSEEGSSTGLGWIKGRTVRFHEEDLPKGYKIPHMGWSDVHLSKPSLLLQNIEEPRFYFAHSYYVVPEVENDILLFGEYGKRFTAAVQKNNIVGVQFHPEKSHSFGMKFLENFAAL